MIKSVYISCPLTISEGDLEAVVKKIKSYGLEHPRYFKRGTAYDTNVYDNLIKTADAFILILPEFKWQIDYDKLTSGCRRELQIARKAKKKLFIAYKTMNGNIDIYAMQTDHLFTEDADGMFQLFKIQGLASTSQNFVQEVTEGNKHTKETAACPVPEKKTSWPDMIQEQAEKYAAQEAKVNKPKEADRPAGVEDVNMYDPKVNINVFNFARSLYHSKYGISATNFHKEVAAFAESERQKAKVAKLAEHYGGNITNESSVADAVKANYSDIERLRREIRFEEKTLEGLETSLFNTRMLPQTYGSLDKIRRFEIHIRNTKDRIARMSVLLVNAETDAAKEAEEKKKNAEYDKQLLRDLSNTYGEIRSAGLDYAAMLKAGSQMMKHHRVPAQEQPLAMLLPKEALAPKEGDKVDSNGYTVEFKNGVWEWEIKNPNYIDERLLMFF